MSDLDRDKIFEGEPRSDYLWCLHCERAYRRDQIRIVLQLEGLFKGETLDLCAYEDCDGDAVLDARDWENVRDLHPQNPVIPVEGEVYPLY